MHVLLRNGYTNVGITINLHADKPDPRFLQHKGKGDPAYDVLLCEVSRCWLVIVTSQNLAPDSLLLFYLNRES